MIILTQSFGQICLLRNSQAFIIFDQLHNLVQIIVNICPIYSIFEFLNNTTQVNGKLSFFLITCDHLSIF